MSSDRDLDLKLDQWMAGGPTEPTHRLKDEAMAKVVVTPQMRGSLLQGRLTNMTAFAGIAAALILAFSGAGLFLTVTDPEPAEELLPSAQLEPGDVVAQVSGLLEGHPEAGQRGEVVFDSGRMSILASSSMGMLLADDARLDGQASWTSSDDFLRPNRGFVSTVSMVIENDGGSWEGILQGWGKPSTDIPEVLSGIGGGDGAYEGLSAYLQFSLTDGSFGLEGYIFPGEMPETP